jgi:large subunit ribosomal protein L29
MTILRLKDLRKMSAEERAKKLVELRTELRRLRMLDKAGGSVENPARIRELRKAIARIMTVQREME